MGYSPIHAQVHDTPESYIHAATEGLLTILAEAGFPMPEGYTVAAHLSFSHKRAWLGKSGKGSVVGMAYHESSSPEENVRHITVSPALAHALGPKTGRKDKLGNDEREPGVLDVLAHEIVHAIDGNKHGHKGPFVEMIRAIGLAGKPTSTYAGDRFIALTARLRESLGEYPHKGMNVNHKAQDTRLVKVACVTPFVDENGEEKVGCRAVTPEGIAKTRGGALNVNITRVWLDEGMAPCCPNCGQQMQEVARKQRRRKAAAGAAA